MKWDRSTLIHHVSKPCRTRIPIPIYHVARSLAFWFQRRRYLKGFTLYGRCWCDDCSLLCNNTKSNKLRLWVPKYYFITILNAILGPSYNGVVSTIYLLSNRRYVIRCNVATSWRYTKVRQYNRHKQNSFCPFSPPQNVHFDKAVSKL